MAIDTSALLAILFNEPERHQFNKLIASISKQRISAGSYLESSIVKLARYGKQGVLSLKLLLSAAGIKIVPLDSQQSKIAAEAYSLFGKGLHPANLNFGDCVSYALAKGTDEPLLFKGDDLSRTDIASAIHG